MDSSLMRRKLPLKTIRSTFYIERERVRSLSIDPYLGASTHHRDGTDVIQHGH